MPEDDLDIIRKRVLMLAEEDTEEGKQWRNVVDAFIGREDRESTTYTAHGTNGETIEWMETGGKT